jgi:hypothetical protein
MTKKVLFHMTLTWQDDNDRLGADALTDSRALATVRRMDGQ